MKRDLRLGPVGVPGTRIVDFDLRCQHLLPQIGTQMQRLLRVLVHHSHHELGVVMWRTVQADRSVHRWPAPFFSRRPLAVMAIRYLCSRLFGPDIAAVVHA